MSAVANTATLEPTASARRPVTAAPPGREGRPCRVRPRADVDDLRARGGIEHTACNADTAEVGIDDRDDAPVA